MIWQILLFISIVTYAVSVLLQRLILKDRQTDPVTFSIVFQLSIGLIFAINAFFTGFYLPNLKPYLPNLLLMVILYGSGNIFMFKALKTLEASEFTIFFSSRAIWTILAALIFLGERFSLDQAVGAALIIGSVAIVSWKVHKPKFSQGELFALLAAMTFGLAFSNDVFILRSFPLSFYLVVATVLPATIVWIAHPTSISKMAFFWDAAILPRFALLSLLFAISAITLFSAYKIGGNAAQIAPLNQTSTIVTVIFAFIFLHERDRFGQKIIGAIFSLIGILLVK